MLKDSLAPDMADPILLDYQLSVKQVYTSVASLVFLNIHSLSILLQVEGKSNCTVPNLPSCVPDWSYGRSPKPLPWLDLSGAFKASPVGNLPLFLPQVFEATLVVSGAGSDRVVETSSYYSDKVRSYDMPESLLLCMNLRKNSSNAAESCLEMLWRTMIADYDTHPPAGAKRLPRQKRW